jgi:hypothetical protein
MPPKSTRTGGGLGIDDLQAPLKFFTEEIHSSRDVSEFFLKDGVKALEWHSNPSTCVLLLLRLIPLAREYAKIVPNTKIPQTKHREALAKMNDEEVPGVGRCRLNFTTKSDAEFIDWLDMSIRVVLYMFKQLKEKNVSQLFLSYFISCI